MNIFEGQEVVTWLTDFGKLKNIVGPLFNEHVLVSNCERQH